MSQVNEFYVNLLCLFVCLFVRQIGWDRRFCCSDEKAKANTPSFAVYQCPFQRQLALILLDGTPFERLDVSHVF